MPCLKHVWNNMCILIFKVSIWEWKSDSWLRRHTTGEGFGAAPAHLCFFSFFFFFLLIDQQTAVGPLPSSPLFSRCVITLTVILFLIFYLLEKHSLRFQKDASVILNAYIYMKVIMTEWGIIALMYIVVTKIRVDFIHHYVIY